jgi:hypothetical protein
VFHNNYIKKIVLLLVLCLHTALFAESIEVLVIDRDLESPLEGAIVEIAGTGDRLETNASGSAFVPVTEHKTSMQLKILYPGYNDRRVVISTGQKKITIALAISGVIEGKELVVERAVPGKTDAKTGVSQVMDAAEMKTTAESGLIEDIMSSINTLPGIGYTGGFNSRPTIRGGTASEMNITMDGISVLNPWHWGGAYSIFNPLMVSSAKMSHGIFSTRYGNALSGLLEVTTKTPECDQARVDASISTMSSDVFIQMPFSKTSGVLFGGKLTYLEPLQMMYDGLGVTDLSDTIPVMPFIRDGYIKAYYNPSPELHIAFNTFIGADGVGVKSDLTEDSITTTSSFSWLGVSFLTGVVVSWLPDPYNQVKCIASYNLYYQNLSYKTSANGTLSYTDEFIARYGSSLGGGTQYTLNDFSDELSLNDRYEQYQLFVENTKQLSDAHSLSFGAEELVGLSHSDEKAEQWTEIRTSADSVPSLEYVTLQAGSDGNRVFQTGTFCLWNFGTDASLLQGEAGIRADHCYIVTSESGYTLNTYPVVNPRVSLQFTPFRNTGIFDRVTFSAGTGLFSRVDGWAGEVKKSYGVHDFDITPDRLLFHVIGARLDIADTWFFSLEGYYKNYLNRMYVVFDKSDPSDVIYHVRNDGKGYVAGFDTMLQKKGGGRWDGYVTYSFVYARYLNPYTPDYSNEQTSDGNPLDTWYYPSYHRFHTVNFILNWRPKPGFTFTVKAAVASGVPREENGDVTSYAAVITGDDGTSTVVQRYTRSSVYSDTLRTQISCPVDIRFAVSNYYKHSKVRWEWYVAVEDIFVNLYSPRTNRTLNVITGKVSDTGESADFDIGFPMPSVGMKISY